MACILDPMKMQFKTVFRIYIVILLVVLFWSIWASAQSTNTGTNVVAVTQPIPGKLSEKLLNLENRLEEHDIIFHLDEIAVLRDHMLFDQPLWKYAASLIFIFLAFCISKLLDYIINAWLKRWASKTETKLDDLLLGLLHGPVKIITFVIFLHIGLTVFQWPAPAQSFLHKGFIVVVAFSLTYVLLKITDLMVGLWRERTTTGTDRAFDEQLFPVIRKSLRLFIVVVAALVTSDNLGINITSVLASLSIGGLALGLAAQDTLGNLFGAVAVFVDKPFRIGDRIRIDVVDGTVESIGMRSTRVRSLEGHHITIPNKMMGNAVITNVTSAPSIKTEMNFGLVCDTPAPKVKRAVQLLEEIYRQHPMTGDLIVSFNKFGESSLNVMVVHWWKGTDGKAHLAGMQELNLAIKERFDAEGINLAFPTRTLHVKREGELPANPAPGATAG